ncbi:hypothetical protein [Streptomyces sp. AC495_CC817]|uniref:hypothetical protein n=1 Tax=Streptomyces sp. AC495_CC817 TaxID=2823900 RepID=UPI001C272306|nr:hypothetical protein [Streptomyces sp. AC495_CC817]
MREIAAGDIRLGDIGSRVVVIDETGNAYTGALVDVSATEWQWGERPEDQVQIRIKVASGEGSKLELNSLPLDFRLQIERSDDRRPDV